MAFIALISASDILVTPFAELIRQNCQQIKKMYLLLFSLIKKCLRFYHPCCPLRQYTVKNTVLRNC